MQSTFGRINPREIVNAYDEALRKGNANSDILDMLWHTFGTKTVGVMADGSKLLARLWASACAEGKGDSRITSTAARQQQRLATLYQKKTFLTSYTLPQIKPHLRK